jgi:hypothetical protein
MRHTTAFITILASILLPASSPSAIETRGMPTHARFLPIALSPSTEIGMTFDRWRFDGSWYVVVFCPEAGGDAPASAYRFTAQVKDGMLHGERGSVGSQGWMTLNGSIQPDGRASLDAGGITNDVDEVLGREATPTQYAYHVLGRFEGSHGIGRRVEGRVCHFNFTRQ